MRRKNVCVSSLAVLLTTIAAGQVFPQADWMAIRRQSEALLQARPNSFAECHAWLEARQNVQIAVMQAMAWRGTIINPESQKPAQDLQPKLDSMAKSVRDKEIDYSTRDPIIRYVKKQFNSYAPERIVLTTAGIGASIALGGAPMVALATSIGFGTAREQVGVLEEDGLLTGQQAAHAKLLLDVAEAINSMSSTDVSSIKTETQLAAYLAKAGIKVVKVVKDVQGYQLTIRGYGEQAAVQITL
jgi:hypothetical protein